jgi:hypothetical protein
MGFGAIVILILLAGMSMSKSAQFIEENEMTGVAAEAILFLINVGLLVWGNPWAWAGWQLTALCKVVFFPSDEVIERASRMPGGYVKILMTVTILLNSAVFALFQWLR